MKKYTGHVIKSVKTGSIAEELEIEAGDILLKINNEILEDVFDYQYMQEEEYLEILIRKASGEEWILEVEKDYDEDLGMEFEQGLMDDYRSCTNKCIFCFIDQMPKGMRETLYFKDDDSRLSFLQGNYVTLTNMSDKDIDRIIKYHLFPINISVQTTNPELRCKMLNNRFAGEALKKIHRLAEACIEMNGQIVLCKGVNDGVELQKSIEDLAKYLPHMRSVSVVPAGLTKYRDGLYPLKMFSKEDACQVIDMIEGYQERYYREYGLHFIHASDEWYILAERDFPQEESYDGYIQLENGVGMMRLLYEEYTEALEQTKGNQISRTISVATGVLAYDMICRLALMAKQKFPNLDIRVYMIKNEFFGETITVSGLLTGCDIINQLKGKELGETLLLPCNVLRAGEEVFLDDVTLEEVKTTLQVDINIVKSGGKDLLDSFTGSQKQEKSNQDGFVYQKCYPEK
ncbi:MAG: DUF512 domain-containing protein [Lachnospiraceae bacterium]|nr:DUF512 domain-containing protein [Lachnospiraceae bacterium]